MSDSAYGVPEIGCLRHVKHGRIWSVRLSANQLSGESEQNSEIFRYTEESLISWNFFVL